MPLGVPEALAVADIELVTDVLWLCDLLCVCEPLCEAVGVFVNELVPEGDSVAVLEAVLVALCEPL